MNPARPADATIKAGQWAKAQQFADAAALQRPSERLGEKGVGDIYVTVVDEDSPARRATSLQFAPTTVHVSHRRVRCDSALRVVGATGKSIAAATSARSDRSYLSPDAHPSFRTAASTAARASSPGRSMDIRHVPEGTPSSS